MNGPDARRRTPAEQRGGIEDALLALFEAEGLTRRGDVLTVLTVSCAVESLGPDLGRSVRRYSWPAGGAR